MNNKIARVQMYRLWDKVHNEMVRVRTIDFDEMGITEIDTETYVWFEENFDKCALMEYTGLRNDKDIKIFEADLVRDIVGEIYEIKYELGSFIATNKNRVWPYPLYGFNTVMLEVIGNIYQNPDIWEKVKTNGYITQTP